MNKPIVSFLMPTFGRIARQPSVINEAVWWFLKQSISQVELVILNDAPEQEVVFDHPKVRVYNLKERVPTLGEKMNRLVELARADVCCTYEDDDLSLPFRAAQAWMKLNNGQYQYWSPKLWFYHEIGSGKFVADGNGYGYTSAAYSRSAMLGNHPHEIVGHDAAAAGWAYANLNCNLKTLTNPADVTYVYRWGISDMHLSAQGNVVRAFQTQNPGKPGRYVIEPAPRFPYDNMIEKALHRTRPA